MSRYLSPLRYPGGKARMTPTVRDWLTDYLTCATNPNA